MVYVAGVIFLLDTAGPRVKSLELEVKAGIVRTPIPFTIALAILDASGKPRDSGSNPFRTERPLSSFLTVFRDRPSHWGKTNAPVRLCS